MVTLYHTGTEWTSNAITLLRGSVSDIVSVGIYHNTDPTVIPQVTDFTTVQLVDGTATPLPPLAQTGIIDIVSLMGPRAGDFSLAAGTYQRWAVISTATEDVIRPVDTIEVK